MQIWLQELLESERDSMFQNETLNLQNRGIDRIDWIPTNRYRIILAHNHLRELPILHPHIKHLDIRGNLLSNLFLLPRNLQSLVISYNPIQCLPSLPKGLLSLQASYCYLTVLPGLPRKLEYLNLSFNHLQKLPDLPEGLQELQMQNNELLDLPWLPPSLRILRFEDNPHLSRYYGKSIEEIRQIICERIAKQRCHAIKEELLQVAWHPTRIDRWLAAGVSPEDM